MDQELFNKVMASFDEEREPKRSVGDWAKDIGLTAAKGVVGAGEGVAGLANMATLGLSGRGLKALGYDPKATKEWLGQFHSEAHKKAQQNVSEAGKQAWQNVKDEVQGGSWRDPEVYKAIGREAKDVGRALIENPSIVASSIGESIPTMFAGGAIGKGIRALGAASKAAPKVGAWLAKPGVAGAIGEGVIGAGAAAEQIRQESPDENLTAKGALYAGLTGLGTGVLGRLGNKAMGKMGIADIEEMLAGGTRAVGKAGQKLTLGQAAKGVVGGAIGEGLFEELPQSAQETVLQNIATGKPWYEGLGESMVQGAFAGGVMGGGANVYSALPAQQRKAMAAHEAERRAERQALAQSALGNAYAQASPGVMEATSALAAQGPDDLTPAQKLAELKAELGEQLDRKDAGQGLVGLLRRAQEQKARQEAAEERAAFSGTQYADLAQPTTEEIARQNIRVTPENSVLAEGGATEVGRAVEDRLGRQEAAASAEAERSAIADMYRRLFGYEETGEGIPVDEANSRLARGEATEAGRREETRLAEREKEAERLAARQEELEEAFSQPATTPRYEAVALEDADIAARQRKTERQALEQERIAALSERTWAPNEVPPELAERLSILETQMNQGEAGQKFFTGGQGEDTVITGMKSTNPEWMRRPKTEAEKADPDRGLLSGAGKDGIRAVLRNWREGRPMTDNQQQVWAALQRAAWRYGDDAPFLDQQYEDIQYAEKRGMTLEAPREVAAGSLQDGDTVLVRDREGEIDAASVSTDPSTGTVTIRDGVVRRYGYGDPVQIEGLKPVERTESPIVSMLMAEQQAQRQARNAELEAQAASGTIGKALAAGDILIGEQQPGLGIGALMGATEQETPEARQEMLADAQSAEVGNLTGALRQVLGQRQAAEAAEQARRQAAREGRTQRKLEESKERRQQVAAAQERDARREAGLGLLAFMRGQNAARTEAQPEQAQATAGGEQSAIASDFLKDHIIISGMPDPAALRQSASEPTPAQAKPKEESPKQEKARDELLESFAEATGIPLEQLRAEYDAVAKRYEGQPKKAPNGKPTNLTPEQWILARTPSFKERYGDWQSAAEIDAMRETLVEWTGNAANDIAWAKGKTVAECEEHFGGKLKPIAYIPEEWMHNFTGATTDNRVYSSKGYFIEHMANHGHNDLGPAEYQALQEIFTSPDEVIKDTRTKKSGDTKDALVFVKRYTKNRLAIVELSEKDGQIILHKSLYNTKGRVYPSLPRVVPGGGRSPISRTAGAAPGGSLSVLGDNEISIDNFVRSVNLESIAAALDANGEPVFTDRGTIKQATPAKKPGGNDEGGTGGAASGGMQGGPTRKVREANAKTADEEARKLREAENPAKHFVDGMLSGAFRGVDLDGKTYSVVWQGGDAVLHVHERGYNFGEYAEHEAKPHAGMGKKRNAVNAALTALDMANVPNKEQFLEEYREYLRIASGEQNRLAGPDGATYTLKLTKYGEVSSIEIKEADGRTSTLKPEYILGANWNRFEAAQKIFDHIKQRQSAGDSSASPRNDRQGERAAERDGARPLGRDEIGEAPEGATARNEDWQYQKRADGWWFSKNGGQWQRVPGHGQNEIERLWERQNPEEAARTRDPQYPHETAREQRSRLLSMFPENEREEASKWGLVRLREEAPAAERRKQDRREAMERMIEADIDRFMEELRSNLQAVSPGGTTYIVQALKSKPAGRYRVNAVTAAGYQSVKVNKGVPLDEALARVRESVETEMSGRRLDADFWETMNARLDGERAKEKQPAPKKEKKEKGIADKLGEHIGGSRADTAQKTGPRAKLPDWAKAAGYAIREADSGKGYVIHFGKTRGGEVFDTYEDALNRVEALVADAFFFVTLNHRDNMFKIAARNQRHGHRGYFLDAPGFATKEEAKRHLREHLRELLEERDGKNQRTRSPRQKGFGEADLVTAETSERVGAQRRTGDATPDDFMSAFGFRGVEFGLWNNQKERQALLNDAYDALMDLADLLNIPARALSLNGELALAFGARGRGGKARAHYEPLKVVINLTKTSGKGTLAHEWLHALDYYFGSRGERKGPISEHYNPKPPENVRPEVYEAFKKIMDAIVNKPDGGNRTDYYRAAVRFRNSDYWANRKELLARAFSAYIEDTLAERGEKSNFLSYGSSNAQYGDEWTAKPYPEGEERQAINKAFAEFFDTLEVDDSEGRAALYSIEDDGPTRANGRPARREGEAMPDYNRRVKAWNDRRKAELKAATDLLGRLVPGLSVRNTRDLDGDIGKLKGRVRQMRNSRGLVIGAYHPGSKTVLLTSDADAATVLHEIGWHAVYDWARANAPELHRQMRDYAQSAPESVKQWVKERYGDFSAEALLDEIGAKLFTESGRKEFEQAVQDRAGRSWYQKVADLFRDLWNRFTGANRADLGAYRGLSPEAAMGRLLQDIKAGRRLAAESGARSVESGVGQADAARLQVAPDTSDNLPKAPDGSLRVGEINTERGAEMHRQPGEIRLYEGEHDPATDKGYGIVHIEARHGREIRQAGYNSAEHFVGDVAANYNEARRGGGGAILLIKKNGTDKVAMIRLAPHESGDFYNVETAYLSRSTGNKDLLWSAAQSRSEAPGGQPAFARASVAKSDQTTPNALPTSNAESVPGNRRAVNDNDDIRYTFAGEQGAAALDKAEEGTHRLDNLAVAREMEKAGKDAKTVKLATGWERGKDGKWRYEIDDSRTMFRMDGDALTRQQNPDYTKGIDRFTELSRKANRAALFGEPGLTEAEQAERESLRHWERERQNRRQRLENGQATLVNVLDAPELFRAYPQLRGVKVVFDEDMPDSDLGGYNRADNTIGLNIKRLKFDIDRLRSVLHHEVQHVIQEIEGFAKGGTAEQLTDYDKLRLSNEAFDKLQDIEREHRDRVRDFVVENARRYMEEWGDVRVDEDGKFSEPYNLDGKEITNLRTLAYAVTDRMIDNRTTPDKALADIIHDADTGLHEFLESEGLYDNAPKAFADIAERHKKQKAELDALSQDPVTTYKRLAGEVEARNTSHRLDMTPEERRASLASETEDVAREDQIVLQEMLGQAASAEENSTNSATDTRGNRDNTAESQENQSTKTIHSDDAKLSVAAVPVENRADIEAELASAIGKTWANKILHARNGHIRVIETQEEARRLVGADNETVKQSENGTIQGFYLNGVAYLVRDGIAKGNVMAVLMHEYGEHAAQLGFRNNVGYRAILKSLENRQHEDSATGKAIREAMERVPEGTPAEHYWSEVAAYIVEANANIKATALDRVTNFFKKWLYKISGLGADNFTHKDLVLFARAAVKAAGREKARGSAESFDSRGETLQPAFMSMKDTKERMIAAAAEQMGVPLEQLQAEYEAVAKRHERQPRNAPNGEASKLTEEQWILARTPSFLRKYGNWAYNPDASVEPVDLSGVTLDVDYRDTNALKKWLFNKYAGQTVTIDSDGAVVGFSTGKLDDSLKRRGKEQRTVYAKLDELIKSSIYFDFEQNDGQSKHINLTGQDIYYAAMKIGDKTYSVLFRFNITKKTFARTYKDHKVVDIEISPAVNAGEAQQGSAPPRSGDKGKSPHVYHASTKDGAHARTGDGKHSSLVYHAQAQNDSGASHARTEDVLPVTLGDLTGGVKPGNVSIPLDANGEPTASAFPNTTGGDGGPSGGQSSGGPRFSIAASPSAPAATPPNPANNNAVTGQSFIDRILANAAPKWRDRWERFIYNFLDSNDPRERVWKRAGSPSDKDFVTIERLRGKKAAAAQWAKVVDNALNGKGHPRALLAVGATPDLLVQVGIPSLGMVMEATTLRKIAGIEAKRDHLHQLTPEQVKALYEEMADPVAVLRYGQNDYTVVTELDENGSPVIVGLNVNQPQGKVQVNEIASAYGKEGFGGYLLGKAREGKIVYLDKKKLAALSGRMSWAQSPGAFQKDLQRALRGKVKYPTDVVKPDFSTETSANGPLFSIAAPSSPAANPANNNAVTGQSFIDRILANAAPKWRDRWERFIYNFLDSNDPRERVWKRAGSPSDKDFVTIERLRGKKAAAEQKRFKREMLDPLLDTLGKAGLSVSDLEEYAHALHTPERNQRMREANAKRTLDELIKNMPERDAQDIKDQIDFIREQGKANGWTESDIQKAYLDLMRDVFNNIPAREQAQRAAERALSPNSSQAEMNRVAKGAEQLAETKRIRDKWQEESVRFAGMTDADAASIIQKWQGDGRYAALQKAQRQLAAINEATLDVLHEAGELGDEEYQAMKNGYAFYVPLHRDGFQDTRPPAVGRSTGPVGSPFKVAKGSMRAVVNILANSVQAHETAINRRHKLEAGRALYEFAQAHPDAGITVERQEKKPTHDKEGNIVMYTSQAEPEDGVFVKVDGVKYLLRFNTDNSTPEGRTLARFLDSVKGADAQLGGMVKMLHQATRWLAAVNTSFSPEFVVTNFSRDFQTAFIHLNQKGIDMDGLKRAVAKDVFPAMRGIFAAERGNRNGAMARWYADYEANGGKVGWMQSYENIGDLANEIQQELKLHQKGHHGYKAWRAMTALVENGNAAIENCMRLATYKALVERGVSRQKAAMVASSLTVDFTQRGKMSPQINALYMFFNASVQGTVRMVQAMATSRKVQSIAGGIAGAGFVLQMLALAGGGDDDSGEPNIFGIPESTRERNIIIMLPGSDGKRYIKIPKAYGYGALYDFGAELANSIYMSANGRKYDHAKGAMRVVSSFANSFNPIQSATLLQALSPTLLDPVVYTAENKSWAGTPLMPEQSPYGPSKPDSYRAWKGTSPIFKKMAESWSGLFGGDSYSPGKLAAISDISPETFSMLWDTGTGGMGRFVGNVVSLPFSAMEGEVESRKVPFLRQVYGEWNDRAITSRYYEAMDRAEIAHMRFKNAESLAERKRLYQEPDHKLYLQSRESEKRIKAMRKRQQLMEAAGNKDGAERMRQRIVEEQAKVLKMAA